MSRPLPPDYFDYETCTPVKEATKDITMCFEWSQVYRPGTISSNDFAKVTIQIDQANWGSLEQDINMKSGSYRDLQTQVYVREPFST